MTNSNRRNVRVKDVVRLTYKLVPAEALDQAEKAIDFLRSKEFIRFPFRPRPLNRISDENMDPGYRSMADAIEKMEQKLDFIIATLDRIGEDKTSGARGEVVRCDLSAGGMLFACSLKLEEGAYLQMSLYLGSYVAHPIHLIAKVQRVSGPDPAWGPQPHRTAVDFEFISEDDREAIITHVFDIQRAQLRASRTTQTQTQ